MVFPAWLVTASPTAVVFGASSSTKRPHQDLRHLLDPCGDCPAWKAAGCNLPCPAYLPGTGPGWRPSHSHIPSRASTVLQLTSHNLHRETTHVHFDAVDAEVAQSLEK